MSPKKLQSFAVATAVKAGKLLAKLYGKCQVVKKKDRQDIATTADIESEKLITAEIEAAFPKHNIFSEEIGLIDKNSAYTWVVDPLDGTKEYARGLPQYGVLISCETPSGILASCVHMPPTNELYSAAKGHGAFEGKRKLRVSDQDKISQSFIYTHPPSYRLKEPEFSKEWNRQSRVARHAYRLRFSEFDARSMCWLAKGANDGYFILHEHGPRWYDIASGILIALEAGAKVTTLLNKPITNRNFKSGIVATNGKIHSQLLKLLRTNK